MEFACDEEEDWTLGLELFIPAADTRHGRNACPGLVKPQVYHRTFRTKP